MIDRQPTPQEQEILKAIPPYIFATIDQVMRQIGLDAQDEKKIRGTQIKLKALLESGYISRIDRPITGKGKQKPIYHITEKAQKYLRGLGIETKVQDSPSPYQLEHILAVNDMLLLAVEFSRLHEGIELYQVKHDYELKQMQLSLIPDGFVHFTVKIPTGTIRSYPILIEVDRGTESQVVIEKKIEAYVQFTRGEYQNAFNLQSATIAWFTTGQDGRLFNLQITIEKALKGLRLPRLGQFFYLGQIRDKKPQSMFLNDHFIIPFNGKKLFPLIDIKPSPSSADQGQ